MNLDKECAIKTIVITFDETNSVVHIKNALKMKIVPK